MKTFSVNIHNYIVVENMIMSESSHRDEERTDLLCLLILHNTTIMVCTYDYWTSYLETSCLLLTNFFSHKYIEEDESKIVTKRSQTFAVGCFTDRKNDT